MARKAVIVIPTYNEEKNIQTLMERIDPVVKKETNWEIQILIVDSNSPDGTAATVEKLQDKYAYLYLYKTEKEGLGKAYLKGFRYAIDELGAYLLFEMDADLSHDPNSVSEFLRKVEKGSDFVIGSRYIKGGSIPSDWGFDRKLYSIIGNLLIRLFFMRFMVTDWTSGFRAIKSWIVKQSLDHVKNYSGYVFQVALLDKAFLDKAKIGEVPIKFVDRREGTSKINSIQYIIQTFIYVFSHSAFIKFFIVGVIGFVVDFGFAYAFINFAHIAKANANALSAEVAIIFNFFLNNFWSFKDSKITGGLFGYIKKFVLFNLISSGSILIQWLGMTVALKFLGDHTLTMLGLLKLQTWVLYKVGIVACVIIPYSYFLYNKVIWKK